jgi:hypothetical protein
MGTNRNTCELEAAPVRDNEGAAFMRRPHHKVGWTCFLVSTLVMGGCSFVPKLVRPPPPPDAWPDPARPDSYSVQDRCTSSPFPPVVDTGLAFGLGTLTYIERNSGFPPTTYALGVASVGFLVGAIYGYATTHQCRRYNALFEDRR